MAVKEPVNRLVGVAHALCEGCQLGAELLVARDVEMALRDAVGPGPHVVGPCDGEHVSKLTSVLEGIDAHAITPVLELARHLGSLEPASPPEAYGPPPTVWQALALRTVLAHAGDAHRKHLMETMDFDILHTKLCFINRVTQVALMEAFEDWPQVDDARESLIRSLFEEMLETMERLSSPDPS